MAYGLRVRDSAGNIKVDITDRLTRVVGSQSTGTSAGSLIVSGQGDVWYTILDAVPTNGSGNMPPQVSLSGNVISWSWPTTSYGVRAVTIIYGVY